MALIKLRHVESIGRIEAAILDGKCEHERSRDGCRALEAYQHEDVQGAKRLAQGKDGLDRLVDMSDADRRMETCVVSLREPAKDGIPLIALDLGKRASLRAVTEKVAVAEFQEIFGDRRP